MSEAPKQQRGNRSSSATRSTPASFLPTMASGVGAANSDSEKASNRTYRRVSYSSDTVVPNFRAYDDSRATGAGYQPFLTSFFKPIITPRGVKPIFIQPASGVPPRVITSYGYYRAQHKTTNAGDAITLWYFYEIGDGPFGDVIFGTPTPDVIWVRRENVPAKPAADRYVSYNDGKRPAAVSLGIKIKRQVANTGFTSASDFETTDAESVHSNSGQNRRKRYQRRRRPSQQSPVVTESEASDGETQNFGPLRTYSQVASAVPKESGKKQNKSPRDNVAEMHKRPVHARSMLARDSPAAIFAPLEIPAARADAYESTRMFFPTRHYLQHFGNIYGEWLADDTVEVTLEARFEINGKFKEDQSFFEWLYDHGYLLCTNFSTEPDKSCINSDFDFDDCCRLCQLEVAKNGKLPPNFERSKHTTVWNAAKDALFGKVEPDAAALLKERDAQIAAMSKQLADLQAMMTKFMLDKTTIVAEAVKASWADQTDAALPLPKHDTPVIVPSTEEILNMNKNLNTATFSKSSMPPETKAELRQLQSERKMAHGGPEVSLFSPSTTIKFTDSKSLDLSGEPQAGVMSMPKSTE